MKKFFGLILGICFLFSGNCLAMQFSQPKEIGITGYQQAGGSGVMIKGATYNDGNYYTKLTPNNKKGYEKGIACYGNGKDALYVHYNFGKDDLKFGGRDIENTIVNDYLIVQMYKITSNEQITLYPLYNTYGPELNYIIIGRRADGRFVKYIDTNEITRRYFGWNGEGVSPVIYRDLSTQGDTLIMEYRRRYSMNGIAKGNFYFKWDENAQWFSVAQGEEQIIR